MGNALSERRRGLSRPLRMLLIAMGSVLLLATTLTWVASAAPGTATVSAVTTPFNGVWLESADGGHYWSADGNGLCRIDTTAGGSTENLATCDVQAKAPTQAVVGAQNPNGTYFVYVADMSSASAGPVRLVYDPEADSGQGRIVANSAVIEGGLNTVGFFSDANGNFRSSSVALGPCAATVTTTPCTALYVGFERSKKIERIDFADQPLAAQAIETISKTNDIRKGVRYGIANFRNADGTTDLYITELGGEGVSVIKDVATCVASEGSPDPTRRQSAGEPAGGCAADSCSGHHVEHGAGHRGTEQR